MNLGATVLQMFITNAKFPGSCFFGSCNGKGANKTATIKSYQCSQKHFDKFLKVIADLHFEYFSIDLPKNLQSLEFTRGIIRLFTQEAGYWITQQDENHGKRTQLVSIHITKLHI